MSKSLKKEYREQLLFNVIVLLFFGVLFFAGTFLDEDVARTLFSSNNTVVAVITSFGAVPFFMAPVLFLGVLYERTVHSDRGKAVKVILCIICAVLALFVGFVGGGAITDRNSFAMLFPSAYRNFPIIAVVSIILSQDKLLAQRIIGLLIILLLAFIAMQGLKYTFNRPRYRTVVLGYDGIGFVPWYNRFEGASEYSELYGIDGDEFLSFPSGHSILGVSTMYILPSLSWIFPKLKKHQLLLVMTGFMFGLIIMFTRIILGAHYLSDVSAGAIIGTVLSLAYTIIQLRISLKQDKI